MQTEKVWHFSKTNMFLKQTKKLSFNSTILYEDHLSHMGLPLLPSLFLLITHIFAAIISHHNLLWCQGGLSYNHGGFLTSLRLTKCFVK